MTESSAEREPLYFPTIVISDAHLGKRTAQAEMLLEFLLNVRCDKLILNGDIIDGWHLMAKKHKKMPELHMRVLDRINEMAANGTEVVYTAGNHDENLRARWSSKKGRPRKPKEGRGRILDHSYGFRSRDTGTTSRIHIADRHIHEDRRGRNILFLHGDQFDPRGLKQAGERRCQRPETRPMTG